jgi:hypothetical protein
VNQQLTEVDMSIRSNEHRNEAEKQTNIAHQNGKSNEHCTKTKNQTSHSDEKFTKKIKNTKENLIYVKTTYLN